MKSITKILIILTIVLLLIFVGISYFGNFKDVNTTHSISNENKSVVLKTNSTIKNYSNSSKDKLLENTSKVQKEKNTSNSINFNEINSYELRRDGAKKITNKVFSAQNPVFSPDDSRVLFTHFKKGYNNFELEGISDLKILDLKSGKIETLVSDENSNVNLPGSSWKNNDVVFSSTKEPHDEIYSVNVNTEKITQITQRDNLIAFEPSYSKDKTKIVFESHIYDDENKGVITVFDQNTKTYTEITSDKETAKQPNFSPVEDKILYQKLDNEQWDIWVYDFDLEKHIKLTLGKGDKTDAVFSPDGKFIVYSSNEGNEPLANIYILSILTGKSTKITDYEGYDGAPSWSNNGHYIAFESTKGDPDNSMGAELYLIKVPDEILTQIDSNLFNLNYKINTTTQIINNWYQPKPGVSWQWQLSGEINTEYDVDLYDIDLENTPKETINKLHEKGSKVICYFNGGAYEPYRSDSNKFPKEVLGNVMEGWEDEKWLDISNYQKFANIMIARLNMAVEKGCDGVEPDNIHGYEENTGFALTYNDQLRYNKWLANEAHKRNLSIALKNDLEQIPDLVDYYDLALNEQCFEYNECELLSLFIENDKAVLNVEYELQPEEFCPKANKMKFSSLKMNYELEGKRLSCDEWN